MKTRTATQLEVFAGARLGRDSSPCSSPSIQSFSERIILTWEVDGIPQHQALAQALGGDFVPSQGS